MEEAWPRHSLGRMNDCRIEPASWITDCHTYLRIDIKRCWSALEIGQTFIGQSAIASSGVFNCELL